MNLAFLALAMAEGDAVTPTGPPRQSPISLARPARQRPRQSTLMQDGAQVEVAPEAPSFGVDYDAVVSRLRENANKSGDDRLWFAGKVAGPGNEARAAAGRLASARPDLFDVRLSAGDARVGAEDQCRHAFALYLTAPRAPAG